MTLFNSSHLISAHLLGPLHFVLQFSSNSVLSLFQVTLKSFHLVLSCIILSRLFSSVLIYMFTTLVYICLHSLASHPISLAFPRDAVAAFFMQTTDLQLGSWVLARPARVQDANAEQIKYQPDIIMTSCKTKQIYSNTRMQSILTWKQWTCHTHTHMRHVLEYCKAVLRLFHLIASSHFVWSDLV